MSSASPAQAGGPSYVGSKAEECGPKTVEDLQNAVTRYVFAVHDHSVHEYNPAVLADNAQLWTVRYGTEVGSEFSDGEDTATGSSACL